MAGILDEDSSEEIALCEVQIEIAIHNIQKILESYGVKNYHLLEIAHNIFKVNEATQKLMQWKATREKEDESV